jgi:hypothetical protein
MSKQFDVHVLNQLTNMEEIELETHSSAGRTQRTIVWVVVEDHDVYVRSVRGQQGRCTSSSPQTRKGQSIWMDSSSLFGRSPSPMTIPSAA